MLWTTAFWKGAAERLIKTFAQTFVGYIIVGTTGLLDIDWTTGASVAGAAALASFLTSIGNADFVAGTPDVRVTVEGHHPYVGEHRDSADLLEP